MPILKRRSMLASLLALVVGSRVVKTPPPTYERRKGLAERRKGLDKFLTSNIWGPGPGPLTEKDFIEFLKNTKGRRTRAKNAAGRS
jgi:hypothetical protein